MSSEFKNTAALRVRGEISGLFNTVITSYGLGLAGGALAMITTYFSTRLFVPEVYGRLSMLSMSAGIIQAVGFVWLSGALIRFGKEEYIQAGGVHQTFRSRLVLLSVIWILTLLAFALSYLFVQDYLATWIGLSGQILWVIPLLVTLMVLYSELSGYLNIFGKYRELAGADLSGQAIKLIAVVLLYLCYGVSGIGWLIVLTVGGMVAQLLYLFSWMNIDYFHRGRGTGIRNPLKMAARYSLPAIGTSILGCIYGPIEIFVIRYFVSIRGVGLFGMATTLNRVFGGFVMLFPGLTFPILQGLKAAENQEAVRRYYQKIVPQATILFAVFISLGLLCMPPILKIFLNERYHPCIGAFLILTYSEIGHLPTVLQSSYSLIYDKVSQTLWVMLVQYLFEIACYFVLIPRIGIEGAAWGWVAAYLTSAFLFAYYVSQEFGISLRPYAAIVLSGSLGIGSLFLTRSRLFIGVQLLAVLGMTVGLGVICKFLKLFDRKDVDLMVAIGVPHCFHGPLRSIYRILG